MCFSSDGTWILTGADRGMVGSDLGTNSDCPPAGRLANRDRWTTENSGRTAAAPVRPPICSLSLSLSPSFRLSCSISQDAARTNGGRRSAKILSCAHHSLDLKAAG